MKRTRKRLFAALRARKRHELQFQAWSKKISVDMCQQGEEFIGKLDIVKMMVDRKSLHYLDVAVKPCIDSVKKDYFKHETMRDLPLAVAEYLITETKIHKTNKLHRLFEAVDEFKESLMIKFQKRQNNFVQELFQKCMDTFFDKIAGFHRLHRRKCIRGLLNLYKFFELNFSSEQQLQTLIRACTTPDPDPQLAIDVLSVFRKGDEIRTIVFDEIPHDFLEILLVYSQILEFDFWGLWRGIGDLSAEFNPVIHYITVCNHPGALVLMKYGFPFLCEKEIYQKHWFLLVSNRLRILSSDPVYKSLLQKQNRTRIVLIWMTFRAIVDFEGTGDITTDSISTLVCLMRCVPEPFVTPSELSRELTPIFRPQYLNALNRICQKYTTVNVFDESHTLYKPRTLKHLCRCRIRRVLANNLSLPLKINELELPEDIKPYLLLEC